MKFSIYQDSLTGARPINQDRMGYAFTRDCLLMLVADGMGGHQRGEAAAQVAMQSVASSFQRQAQPALADPPAFLDEALLQAHRDILQYQVTHGMSESPRTTVVACLVQGGKAWWAHAGDSRAYWIRNGAVVSRTRDHSKVESLLAMGLLAPGAENRHPDRNKVLNCLGSPFQPTIEVSPGATLQPGDLLLLCSDGVWAPLAEGALIEGFIGADVKRAVPDLVRRSVAAAGRLADNATALAMRWDSDAPATSPMTGAALLRGAVTTTIDISPDAEPEPPITEADIDRAVAEIQDEIARTAAR